MACLKGYRRQQTESLERAIEGGPIGVSASLSGKTKQETECFFKIPRMVASELMRLGHRLFLVPWDRCPWRARMALLLAGLWLALTKGVGLDMAASWADASGGGYCQARVK